MTHVLMHLALVSLRADYLVFSGAHVVSVGMSNKLCGCNRPCWEQKRWKVIGQNSMSEPTTKLAAFMCRYQFEEVQMVRLATKWYNKHLLFVCVFSLPLPSLCPFLSQVPPMTGGFAVTLWTSTTHCSVWLGLLACPSRNWASCWTWRRRKPSWTPPSSLSWGSAQSWTRLPVLASTVSAWAT